MKHACLDLRRLRSAPQAGPVDFSLPVGLNNIGNTCYLNSLLQYLYTVEAVRDIVLNFDEVRCLAFRVQLVIGHCWFVNRVSDNGNRVMGMSKLLPSMGEGNSVAKLKDDMRITEDRRPSNVAWVRASVS